MNKFVFISILLLSFTASARQQNMVINKTLGQTQQVYQSSRLEQAFLSVAALDNFTLITGSDAKELFPGQLGDVRYTIHGNSDPREQVLGILNKIPQQLLYFEQRTENNKITRVYIEDNSERKGRMLFAFVGLGGNDLLVAEFSGESVEFYKKIADEMR